MINIWNWAVNRILCLIFNLQLSYGNIGTSKQPSNDLIIQNLGKHEYRYQFGRLSYTVHFSISTVCNTLRELKAAGRMNITKVSEKSRKIATKLVRKCLRNVAEDI